MTGASMEPARLAEIDRLAERELATTGLPGLAIGLTGLDGPVDVRTHGFADLAARRAIEPDTLFEIGSIGKTFTAIALLQLVEEGRLDLAAPVVDALPWFEMPVVGRPITIHDLLTHTAGITAGIDGTPEATSQVWALRDRRPGSAPGERYHYSNLGYKTLGLVIEAVEGRPYPERIRARILEPLGMAATEPAITNEIRSRLAVGYDYLHDDRIGYPGRPLVPATWLETATADGSVASTAGDMAAFARMLLRQGEGPKGRLLSESSFARMVGPHARTPRGNGYGYGLFTLRFGSRTFLGHPGGMIGYLSALLVDPEAGLAAVVLQNGSMGDPMALAQAALAAVRGPRVRRQLRVGRPRRAGCSQCPWGRRLRAGPNGRLPRRPRPRRRRPARDQRRPRRYEPSLAGPRDRPRGARRRPLPRPGPRPGPLRLPLRARRGAAGRRLVRPDPVRPGRLDGSSPPRS
jgi:CubicO group peptidase (beta-lactamase class C family)